MKTTHTPGPWTARKIDYHVTIFTEAINYDNYQICEVWNGGPKEGNEELQKECNANADLIAAAPDLLKALEDLIEDIKSCSGGSDEFTLDQAMSLVDDAVKVVNKAKGL